MSTVIAAVTTPVAPARPSDVIPAVSAQTAAFDNSAAFIHTTYPTLLDVGSRGALPAEIWGPLRTAGRKNPNGLSHILPALTVYPLHATACQQLAWLTIDAVARSSPPGEALVSTSLAFVIAKTGQYASLANYCGQLVQILGALTSSATQAYLRPYLPDCLALAVRHEGLLAHAMHGIFTRSPGLFAELDDKAHRQLAGLPTMISDKVNSILERLVGRLSQ